MTLQHSTKRHIRIAMSTLFPALFLFTCCAVIGFNPMVLLFTALFTPVVVLSVWLHRQYEAANKDVVITVSADHISVNKAGVQYDYLREDIAGLVFNISRGRDHWGGRYLPCENYYYLRIIPRSGSDIIITSLMADKSVLRQIVDLYNDKPFEKRHIFFCSLSKR